MDTLDRIDHVLADLCPCGAKPALGSAYCSYDCQPTHIAVHTDQRESGEYATPMRWRPDLVTAVEDDDLEPVEFERCGYTGRFNARIFRRDPNTLHLRLDDGHRYVGCDVADDHSEVWPLEFVERVLTAWSKLERHLTDERQTEPARDPWVDVMGSLRADWQQAIDHWVRREFGGMLTAGPPSEPVIGVVEVPLQMNPEVGRRIDRWFFNEFTLPFRPSWLPKDPAALTIAVADAFQNPVLAATERACTPLLCDAGEGAPATGGVPLLDFLVAAQAEAALRDRASRLLDRRRMQHQSRLDMAHYLAADRLAFALAAAQPVSPTIRVTMT